MGAVLRVVGQSSPRIWTASLAVVMSASMSILLVVFRGMLWESVVAAVVGLGAVGATCSAVATALKIVRGIASRVGDAARAVEAADQGA
jgi:hypothetical protein